MNNFTYIIVSPDFFRKGYKVSDLLFELEKNKFYLKDFKFVKLNMMYLEKMYGLQVSRSYPNWWIVEKLFISECSLVLLLKKDVSDASVDLTLIKSHLREKYIGYNKIMNCFHTPDSFIEFQREVYQFFDLTFCYKRNILSKDFNLFDCIDNNKFMIVRYICKLYITRIINENEFKSLQSSIDDLEFKDVYRKYEHITTLTFNNIYLSNVSELFNDFEKVLVQCHLLDR